MTVLNSFRWEESSGMWRIFADGLVCPWSSSKSAESVPENIELMFCPFAVAQLDCNFQAQAEVSGKDTEIATVSRIPDVDVDSQLLGWDSSKDYESRKIVVRDGPKLFPAFFIR